MKHHIKLAMAIVAIFTASCSEKDYSSYCPTWKGFVVTKGNYPDYVKLSTSTFVVSPGDSLHITACQDKRGQRINSTNYTWSIMFDTLDTSGRRVHVRKDVTIHTNYDGYVNGDADPVWHGRIPANALPTAEGKRDTVQFSAEYKYSGQGVIVETGGIVSNSSTYAGRITPQSGPMSGGANGVMTFTIR